MIAKYHDRHFIERAFEMAWFESQELLRLLGITEADAQTYGHMATSVIHASALRRSSPGVIARNQLGQPGLWRFGISGDLPIVLVKIWRLQPHRPRETSAKGTRLLAQEGAGDRPAHLERGLLRIPRGPSGRDHGSDRSGTRSLPCSTGQVASSSDARRNSPKRTGCCFRPSPVSCSPAQQRIAGRTCAAPLDVRPRARLCCNLRVARERGRSSPCRHARASSPAVWAASLPTAASTSSAWSPVRALPRRGPTS